MPCIPNHLGIQVPLSFHPAKLWEVAFELVGHNKAPGDRNVAEGIVDIKHAAATGATVVEPV